MDIVDKMLRLEFEERKIRHSIYFWNRQSLKKSEYVNHSTYFMLEGHLVMDEWWETFKQMNKEEIQELHDARILVR